MTFSWIDLISSLLGLTCVFLAGRGSKYNFWVGYLYTAALFFLFLQKNLLASLLLQPVSLGINILGHYRWTHPKAGEVSSEKTGELKVSMLNWYERVLTVAIVLVVAALWGWLLQRLFPADPHPYCWVAWIIVNITQLILHLSVGNIFMPIVSALYLVNSIVSLYNWEKMYRRKA